MADRCDHGVGTGSVPAPPAMYNGFQSTPGRDSPMSDDGSVTRWIAQLKSGEPDAAQALWNRYYDRLIGLAFKKFRLPRRVADEEDVVVDVFASLCHRAREGQFPQLCDRDELWHLLVTSTERKTLNRQRAMMRQKRGGTKVRGESVLQSPDESAAAGGLDALPAPMPEEESAAALGDVLRGLIGGLDGQLAQVAQLKLEGHTNEEIARRINRSVVTVERRLKLIRDLWQKAENSDAATGRP